MGFLKELIARTQAVDVDEQPVEAPQDDESGFDAWLEDDPETEFADGDLNDIAEPDAGADDPEDSDELAMPDEERTETSDAVDDADIEEPAVAEADDDEPEPEMAKIWEMLNDDAAGNADVSNDADAAQDIETSTENPTEPSPQELAREAMNDLIVRRGNAAKPSKRGGRDKTRILGFGSPEGTGPDIFKATGQKPHAASDRFPLGWLVIVEGPGRGTSFTLQHEVSSIGRGSDQRIRVDFGDNSISRENHAAIAFDDDLVKFFVGHGGKSNLVRLNGRPVLMTEEITDGDLIRLGETTLRFVAFCSAEFAWDLTEEPEDMHARTG